MKCDHCKSGDAIAAGADNINCLGCGYFGPAPRPATADEAPSDEAKKPRLRRGTK